jgi:4'-phosphopantetheinyl transferase
MATRSKGAWIVAPFDHDNKNIMPSIIYWTLVDAYRADLDNPSSYLSPAEIKTLAGLRFPKRRNEWLLGRWSAKSLVASLPQYKNLPLQKIEIQNMLDGAPIIHLPGGYSSPACLSISHRDDLATCSLVTDPQLKVGIDLEKIEPRATNFVEDYFTRSEQDLVNSYASGTQAMVTTLIWSAKESMLKAIGVGLHWDTRQVEIKQIRGPDTPHGIWNDLEVFTHHADHQWSANWRSLGGYVLTLVVLSKLPADITVEECKLYTDGRGDGI